IDRIEVQLTRADVSTCVTFIDLKELIEQNLDTWAGSNAASGTKSAFLRRLEAAAYRVGHLIRGRIEDEVHHRVDWRRAQMTVIDIHNLHDRAKRFVIGVVLKRMFEERRRWALPVHWCSLSSMSSTSTHLGKGGVQ